MSTRLALSKLARKDIAAISSWYRDRSDLLARAFLADPEALRLLVPDGSDRKIRSCGCGRGLRLGELDVGAPQLFDQQSLVARFSLCSKRVRPLLPLEDLDATLPPISKRGGCVPSRNVQSWVDLLAGATADRFNPRTAL